MGSIAESLLNPFYRAPSFKEFVLASHRAKHEDHLVYEGGLVNAVSNNCHHGHEGSKVNQRAWSAFSRAVKRAFTEEKIKQICARYRFDFEKLSTSTHPLERRYVEYFGVGSASATITDLLETLDSESTWFWWKLRDLAVKEIRKIYDKATENSYLGDVQDPKTISGAPRDTHENFVQDYSKMDQQRCNLFQGISELVSKDPNIPRLHPYLQRLSMGITSLLEKPRDLEDPALIIPAPGATDGELDFYRVYDVISGGGLTAVALVPVSDSSYLDPIISFRCTKQALGQEDAVLSLMSDMENHIGQTGYKQCQDKLVKLVNDSNFSRGKKFKILSYSQGGGPAGYLMQDLKGDLASKMSEYIAFNIVGSDDKVVEDIAQSINNLPPAEVPPAFTLHRVRGDWVNKSGKKHPGWGIKHLNSRVQVIEWDINDYPIPSEDVYDPTQMMPWLNLHGVRAMDAPREYERTIYRGPTACDAILDTYNRDRTLEDKRQHLGNKIMLRVIGAIYSTIDFFARLFGVEFFRKNM